MPSLAVNAGPGTGKSYTGKKIPKFLRAKNISAFLKHTPHTDEQIAIWEWVKTNVEFSKTPSLVYCAFNNDTVNEIKPDMPSPDTPYGVEVRTIHGLGYKVLRNRYGYLPINQNRGTNMVQQITGQSMYNNKWKDRFKWLASVKYLEKLKDELLQPTMDNLEALASKYDNLANLGVHDDMPDQIQQLTRKMKEVQVKTGVEYIDQVWLPLFMIKQPIYDLGIVDECQDLSASRLALVRALCRNIVYVGDPDQAINAFAGADAKAFERIRSSCQDELPLKTSFRCPINIVRRANHLMTNRVLPEKRIPLRGIRTDKGKERRISFNTIAAELDDNYSDNLILCRYNAPLFRCAFNLTKAGIPCAILGRTLAEGLVSLVKQRKAVSIEDLMVKLKRYEEYSLQGTTSEMVRDAITDKMACVYTIVKECAHLDDVEPKIRAIFKIPKGKSHVTLSTIHKAKGKERKNIFVLFPPIESEYATTPEQRQQEQNLHFVALTRTQQDYIEVYEA